MAGANTPAYFGAARVTGPKVLLHRFEATTTTTKLMKKDFFFFKIFFS
jgi:hypothetical protein